MKDKIHCPICRGTGEFQAFTGMEPCFRDPDEVSVASNAPRVHAVRNRNHINQNVELISIYSEAERLEVELRKYKFQLEQIRSILSK